MSASSLILSVAAILQLSQVVCAQKLLQNYDSLPLAKPRPIKPTFVFPPPGIGTATLEYNGPISLEVPPPSKPFEGLGTLLTGIGTSRSYTSNYLETHEVNVDDPLKSWRVHLFCSGETTTSRQREKNDDGSFSINKTKTLQLSWESGAQGYLFEQSDTVGVFLIIWDPSTDKDLTSRLTSLEQQYEIPAIALGAAKYSFPPTGDHAVYGKLRDKFFHIIVSGRRFVSLILFDEKPVGIFRSDFNHLLLTNKKWRFEPYMLVDKSLNDVQREDVMRLAMVGWLTTKALGSRKFEK